MAEQIAAGLSWVEDGEGALVVAGKSRTGRTLLEMRPTEPGRVRCGLCVPAGRGGVDLSARPGALLAVLTGHAAAAGHDPGDWCAALAGALLAAARRWGTWQPPSEGRPDVRRFLGGMTHPLLGRAYDAGVATVGEIPAWASPALTRTDARGAARTLWGPGATRPVVRALARCCAPHPRGRAREAPPLWWHLAWGVAAAGVLEPDQVAAVLSAPPLAAVSAPGTDDVAAIRRALTLLGPPTSTRLLLAGLTEGDPHRLLAVLSLFGAVHRDIPGRPPAHLDRLERACLAVARVDPGPATRGRPTARRNTDILPAPPPPTTVRTARGRTSGERLGRFVYVGAVADLHQHRLGELTLVLPRTPAELHAWGGAMGNCLGAFAPAVAADKSVVVGVRHNGALVAALELRRGNGSLRQFLGPHNRPAPPGVVTPVLRHLKGVGLAR